MAGRKSKNNPNERNAQAVKTRVCEFCGEEGELGVKVVRVKRNRTMVWKCKDQHYDI
jgi:ribosomal protein L37AE/L43A